MYGSITLTGTHDTLRFTGESLAYNIGTESSNEIRSDRNISVLAQVSVETSGDINFELSYGTFDKLIAAALGSAWSNDTLVNGTTLTTFSIEKGFSDIGQFISYTGMGVNTMSLSFDLESIVSGSFGFVGQGSVINSTSQMPGTAAAATTTGVMNSVSHFSSLSVGGTTYPCGISAVDLNIDAGIRAQNALGKMEACAIVLGTMNVTGSLTAYFEDAALYTRYIQGQETAITWTVKDDADNEYVFTLPRVKFT